MPAPLTDSASALRVQRHASGAAFLERAAPWLLQSEAENNLILGLAIRLRQDTRGFQLPVYMATVESGESVVGCVLRTPPYKPILTDMPMAAVSLVVADLASVYRSLPAVLGPEPQARRFAELWSETAGVNWSTGRASRIYQLSRVLAPPRPARGHARLADLGDVDLVTAWIIAFSTEVSMPLARARSMAEDRIRHSELFLWVDGDPCSMAAWSGTTPNSVRIGFVYTPPELRGRGYASACTAEASQKALAAGYRFCYLFTDLANPTSNAIYQTIGYEPVGDVIDYLFDEEA